MDSQLTRTSALQRGILEPRVENGFVAHVFVTISGNFVGADIAKKKAKAGRLMFWGIREGFSCPSPRR
jgi:hypothetical protein